ncbi:phosphatases II [Phlegmacium glaucopus]|nr:phosphatases II [Phlegmacium glaucopus]
MIRFDSLPPEVMQAMCTPMHQILAPTTLPSHPSHGNSITTGALYLGSLSAATDKDLLRQHHITHVVHVLGDGYWFPSNVAEESVWKDGVCSYRIDILDETTADLGRHLKNVCGFIDRTLRSGRNLLIHCHQGISRSASITIAYLIHNHGMSFETAHALVKRKRACIKPNSGFVRVLQEWDVACHGGRSSGGAHMRPPANRYYTS